MRRHVHLVGIGGAGLSAIARVLAERGDIVTGSDRAPSAFAEALEQYGLRVMYGHRSENVTGADLVLASSAVPDDNPELTAARQAGIPVVRRAQFLGEMTAGYRTIAIAGTHGKTTTTGLIAWILERAGRCPSYIVGGTIEALGGNAHHGSGKDFVIEADEYDRTFLGLQPDVAVLTYVEHDHPDCYPTPESFLVAFRQFVDRVRDMLIVCLDDPGAASLGRPGLARMTYGFDARAEWRALDVEHCPDGGSAFRIERGGRYIGSIRTALPGDHNVLNVVAAVAATLHLGVSFDGVATAVGQFRGVGRRFELMGEAWGVTVIDDYAHHPTEAKATLAAARRRYPGRRVWAVLQPHTFSRTKALLHGWLKAFADADRVIVTDIYAARERIDPSIDGASLASRIEHPDVRYVGPLSDVAEALLAEVSPGDVIIIMSAGDANTVGWRVLESLSGRLKGAGDDH